MGISLAELARRCQAELRGDPRHIIERVSTPEDAGLADIVFVAVDHYRAQLSTTSAGAVILDARDAGLFSGNMLLSPNPRLCYARVAALLHPSAKPAAGIHATAVIDPGSVVHASATIGACVVIEAGARIGANVVIGAGSYIGAEAVLGTGTQLHPHVYVGPRCELGVSCVVHAGAVIGSDGFGFAQNGDHWEKIPQLGRVLVGDNVEIGANTAIDRGAIGDTRIERGVKLDNLIHIAHNVQIGEDTAIAACVGIAGSTHIGKRCTIGGQAGIVGHIEITDDVHITGATVVTHTIREPGAYSSGAPLETHQGWLKNAVRMRQLDDMARRLKKLEQKLSMFSEGGKVE
jgi:UDP-3-O-[3-hydroxymyristoyl] glucosamine N-acyltransferase